MDTLQVIALYPNASMGAEAAWKLRQRGLKDITIASVENTNPNLLPDNPVENKKSLEKAYGRVAIGLIVGGGIGLAAGVLGGAVWAMVLTALGAALGGVAGLMVKNKTEDVYTNYMAQGGAKLTVHCSSEHEQHDVAQLLKNMGSDKVSITTPGGGTIDGTIIPPTTGPGSAPAVDEKTTNLVS